MLGRLVFKVKEEIESQDNDRSFAIIFLLYTILLN